MVWRKASSAAAFVIAAATLAGCAATTERLDHYAERVTTYNKEAELAQDRGILLNILRASKRRPLSFFELQSVSASGTPSGQVGFSIPLAQNGGASASSVSPQFGLSSGPTVSANYIDTQEFYQGILKPIPMDTIDFFVQRGISDNLLFNLFFSKAIVKVHGAATDADGPEPETKTSNAAATRGPWQLVVSNYAGSDVALDRYQQLVESLLNAGLSTEPVDADPSDFGPVLTGPEAASPDFLGKAAGASLQLNAVGWCDLSIAEHTDLERRIPFAPPDAASEKSACKALADAKTDDQTKAARKAILALLTGNAPTTFYRLQKKAGDGSHVFCFSRTSHQIGAPPDAVVTSDLCDTDDESKSALSATAVPGVALKAFFDGLDPASLPCATKAKADCATSRTYDVTFAQRSTYGVIYYLGEVARRKLYPDQDEKNQTPKRQVMVRMGSGAFQIPHLRCGDEDQRSGDVATRANFSFVTMEPKSDPGHYACKAVFDLEDGGARHFLSVDYDGRTFSMPDGAEAGVSNEVLDVVSELLALTRSSKDAPTSSLVTLVGH